MKLLAMAASFRSESTNKRLLHIAAAIAAAQGAEVTHLDYSATDCPALRDDKPVAPLPAGVNAFSSALHACDGMILAVPEYNWSIPGAFKNLIDWMSVDPSLPFKGKTALRHYRPAAVARAARAFRCVGAPTYCGHWPLA